MGWKKGGSSDDSMWRSTCLDEIEVEVAESQSRRVDSLMVVAVSEEL